MGNASRVMEILRDPKMLEGIKKKKSLQQKWRVCFDEFIVIKTQLRRSLTGQGGAIIESSKSKSLKGSKDRKQQYRTGYPATVEQL